MEGLRIGLFGFGKTGAVVAKEIMTSQGVALKWVCRKTLPPGTHFASHAAGESNDYAPFVTSESLDDRFLLENPVDVVIDFSAGSAVQSYSRLAKHRIRIVSAISHYTPEEIAPLRKASTSTAILYSPNITLGINCLIIASRVLRSILPHADVEIIEEHFRTKQGASGTAMRIADHLELDPSKQINSIRVGGIVGKHEVIFGLPHQTIRLTHESVSRSAFGTGAIFAARWLAAKAPGLYSMEQLIQEIFLAKVKDLELSQPV